MSQQRKTQNGPRSILQGAWTKRPSSQPPPLYSLLDSQAAQIRILDLLPGRWDEPLSGVLRVVSLNANPTYEAISYTWGLSTEHNTISISKTHDVPITDNLFRALKRLRQQLGKRRLWIDALCIDQKNKQERAQQVSMMGAVYKQAKAVLLWLGEYPNPSALDPWRMRRPHLKTKKGPVRLNSCGRAFTIALDTAIRDSQPRWPDRGWIVQEFVLAKRIVLCFGPISIDHDFGHIVDILMVSRRPLQYLRAFHERTTDMQRLRYGLVGRRQSIWGAALYTSTASCSDAHDKVYSLLSLIDESEVELIGCDYDRSPAETFATATFASLITQRNFKIWELVNCDNRRVTAGVPTWSIDFNVVQSPSDCEIHEMIDESVQWPMHELHHAQLLVLDSSGKLLTVRGTIFDRISRMLVMPTTDTFCQGQEAVALIQDLAPFLTAFCGRGSQDAVCNIDPALFYGANGYLSVSRILDVACILWDDIVGDVSRNLSTVHQPFWFCDEPERIQRFRHSRAPNVAPFLRYSAFAGGGCSMLATAEGYLGWAPRTIEVEDLIVLIPGCKLPIALRPIGQFCSFQGFVFVHDTMDGELLETWKGRSIAETEFVLI